MPGANGKKKVAILGGGMGALAAAYELSEHDDYEITVYQLGWRLGGQGASGRNTEQSDRIEEHGLHVWFGFYEHAFNLMRRCYAALGRPAGAPLATVEQAFRPVDYLDLEELHDGKRIPWVVRIPTNSDQPGVGGEISTTWGALVVLLEWLVEMIEQTPVDSSSTAVPDAPHETWLGRLFGETSRLAGESALTPPGWVRAVLEQAEARLEQSMHQTETWLLRQGLRLAQSLPADPAQHREEEHGALAWVMKAFAGHLWQHVKDRVPIDNDTRRLWALAYLGCTSFAGILGDKVLFHGFDPLDEYDLTDWFYSHKLVDDPTANDTAYRSAPVQTLYDLLFHYEDGDTSRPRVAAGVGLVVLMRIMFGFKGSVLWFMQSSMGDTIFAPLYEVMRRRGVRFKFFHRVTGLGLSDDRRSLATVTISRQVNLNVGEYDPLIIVKDLEAWPSQPRYEQIVEGEALKQQGINLERSLGWTAWQDTGGTITLKAGEDFDHVILGIGIGALPLICGELAQASPQWQAMIEHVKTVKTQAIQLWLKDQPAELDETNADMVVGAYAEPYSSLTDFSHLLARENWAASADANTLIYSCGVLQDLPGETQAQADARVKQIALDFLKRDSGPLWPADSAKHDPDELKWSSLVGPDDLRGEVRFDAQYWRANVDPVERYVLSLPGTNQYRLKAGESGFGNLILAGNWIDTGFNIACIESAALSGRQAAAVLTGEPV